MPDLRRGTRAVAFHISRSLRRLRSQNRLPELEADKEATQVKYRTLVVDPPWAYRQKWAQFSTSMWKAHRVIRGSDGQYGSMTTCELKALPVGEWAEDDAHLYLWTTNGFMREAYEIADAWGFEVKTILTWVKPGIGMGYYYRNNTEHVLFAVRGSLKTFRRDVPTAFDAPTTRHSAKPQAFYDMVETMSPGPYLDVFNRNQRLGWDAWGYEAYTPEGLPEPVR